MLEIIVDNRIRVHAKQLVKASSEDVLKKLKARFEHDNPEFGLKKRLGLPVFNVPKEIVTWKETRGEISFPRGGMGRVREVLIAAGVTYKVYDQRTDGGPNPKPLTYCGKHQPRYYQVDGWCAAMKKQNCILRAPTGSGKTSMALMLVGEMKVCTLVIVSTTALFKQWQKRAQEELGISPRDLGIIQGGTRKLRPLTIALQKTLANVVDDEITDYFGAVICDEVQLFAARTFFASVDPFPAKYRVGVSADERRKDRKEFLNYDLFGDVAHEISRKTLEDEGHVLDVQIRVMPTGFRADWYGLPDEDDENDDREIDFDRLLKEMVDDERRNEIATDIALSEVEDGEQVIMLSHRREHCQKFDRVFVAERIKSGYLIGGDDYEHEFDQTRAGIDSGDVQVAIGTYQAIGYGVDLPAIGVGIATTPIASNKQQFNQARGRFCRAPDGKTSARFYYLWDELVYPGHLKNIVAWNPSVVVYERGKWVPGREYLRKRKKRKRAA